MRTLRLLMAVTVILYGTAGSVLAANPQKTLNQIKKVDGAGSGLDADLLQGQTPAAIVSTAVNQATSNVANGLVAILNSAYTRLATITVFDGFCNTVDTSCDDANDFLLSCGAAVDLTSGYLTASTEIPGANGTCRAGGCGFGGATSVAVTATCLRL
jgi:hypothetical protein